MNMKRLRTLLNASLIVTLLLGIFLALKAEDGLWATCFVAAVFTHLIKTLKSGDVR